MPVAEAALPAPESTLPGAESALPAPESTLPAGPSGASLAATVGCPACGHDNGADRAFCKSCGSGLPRSAGAASRSAPIPAPVPVPAPLPVSGTAPRPADHANPALVTPRPVESRPLARRGGSGWVVVILALGLLAGVLGVLLPGLLAGGATNEALPGTPDPSTVLPAAGLPRPLPTPIPTLTLTLEVTA